MAVTEHQKRLNKILAGEPVFESRIEDHESNFLDFQSKPFALYGLGECSHWFHEIGMKRNGTMPIIALDQNPVQDDWWGIRTSTPADFASNSDLIISKLDVIVSVGNRATFDVIKQYLLGLGFEKIHFLHDFYEFHSFFVWKSEEVNDRIATNINNFRRSYSLLSDDLSKEIFCRLLQVHVRKIPLDIPASARNQQYFPDDIFLKKGHDNYVCCGAYDGENIRMLASRVGRATSIICFEPERKIFPKLQSCAEKHTGAVAQEIICLNRAVYDRDGIVSFCSDSELGSRIDASGDRKVECSKLDTALQNHDVSFISMDIEGAEVPAINGAKKIIEKLKPDLGVCVYHYPEQVADVICAINEIDEDYSFFIRNYTGYLTETVVYATQNGVNFDPNTS